MQQNLGLLAIAMVAFPIVYSATYRKALRNGENSIAMMLIGRMGCLWMSKLLAKLGSLSKGNRVRIMHQEALHQIELAKKKSVVSGSICFVGSSTFTFWTNMSRDLAPLECVNLAFGGSITNDLMAHVDEYARFNPKIIVYYCGANDLSHGFTPQATADGFIEFAREMRQRLPKAGFVYLSISLTPLQMYLGNAQKVRQANSIVEEYIRNQDKMTMVDITNDSNFTENWDWYLNDGLHLNNFGHVKLGEVLRPAIQRFEATLDVSS